MMANDHLPPRLQIELNEIKKLLQENFINSKEILSAKETSKYLNISYSKLTKLTSLNLIPFYKPTNGILFFFKEELHLWIKDSRVYSESDADNLIRTHKNKK
jgi:excisionase family DNA binding protein